MSDGRGVDRWAWGSDRHMPSTQDTVFKHIHAHINSPVSGHGKLITMNTAAEFRLGLWLFKKGGENLWLTVPNSSLSAIPFSPIPEAERGNSKANLQGPAATLSWGRYEELLAQKTQATPQL